MARYIELDVLVAEIERLKSEYMEHTRDKFHTKWACGVLDHILSFLDTLELKEVDLEKYYHEFLQKEWFGNRHVRTVSEMMAFTAKHFFELGIKAQKGEEV